MQEEEWMSEGFSRQERDEVLRHREEKEGRKEYGNLEDAGRMERRMTTGGDYGLQEKQKKDRL